jgi:hypothetical protein
MNLSNKNLEIATQYFLGNTKALDVKDDDFKNLFLTFATDNNSSTIREQVTLHYLGYQPYQEKHGADGIDTKTGRQKEVKPRFLHAGKLGNSGNFNDMTLELLEKKKDYDIVNSLFYQSHLVYIVEFPMSVIFEKLKKPITNAKLGKRVVCHFNYLDYNSDELQIHYYNKKVVDAMKCISNPHKIMLESRLNGKTS